MIDLTAVERQTQRIGRDLFAQVQEEAGRFFRSEQWTARLLNWAMRHEETKVKLFRFVDVLPALRDDTSVARHLEEYFRGGPDPFGGLLKLGLGLAGAGRFGARAAATTLRRGVEQVARSFIAGSTVNEVLKVIEEFHQQRQGSTIDILGEATLSEEEAEVYQQRYLELLQALTEHTPHWPAVEQVDQAPWGRVPRANISLKLSALYSQLDPIDPSQSMAGVLERLKPILERAREHQAHLHLDMEDYQWKDLTLYILRHIGEIPDYRDYRYLGVVIQAYLQDSEEDARQLIEWVRNRGTPITVRLVKGAYWDFETVHARLENWPVPVYEHKWETDACFERLTRLFLENRDAIDLAIGSHNIRSISHALALAHELNLPPRTLEFQFLYGMATPLRQALTRMGERVRVYTPYGELIPGMAYLVRRLLENTSNESFLRRGFVEQESPEKLLRNPLEIGREQREVGKHSAGPPAEERDIPQRYGGWRTGPEFGLPPYQNEPLTNFAYASNYQRMRQALETVRAQLGLFYPLIIGADAIETTGQLISVDPSQPAQIIGRTGRATIVHVEQAVAVAAKAFSAWRAKPVRHRVEVLRQAAEIMRQRRFALAALICLEAGKPWREADADVCEAIDFIEWYARQALYLAEPRRMANLIGEHNHYLYEPRGVAAIIAPWNFPLAILTGMASAALVSGNTVILKPAEQTPVIAAKLLEIYREAGIPAGVINYLPGLGEEAGAALVRHPQVHIIAFTGSQAVGLQIIRTAADVQTGQRHIKRVITEMGGKNAIIIDDDADLDEAVSGVTSSAFGYAGQKCSAASRVIVLEQIYDAFLHRLVEATRSLIIGAAWDPATFIGPVIEEEARRRILAYIERGHHEGKAVLIQEVPAHLQELGGYYVAPAIFTEVSRKATIAREEIFGPVLAILRARDFDEAIDMAMDSDYKLTGGIFSRSPARIQRARQAFRVGNLYINRKITGARVGRQPFGGLGLSGTGFQSGGPDYLKQFVETRVVTENTLRRGFADEGVV